MPVHCRSLEILQVDEANQLVVSRDECSMTLVERKEIDDV